MDEIKQPAQAEMTFGEHLEELRNRIVSCILALIATLAVCFIDQDFYMAIIIHPHTQAMQALNQTPTLQVLRYEESFFSYLKVSFIVALIYTAPYLLYQMWMFIGAGLYESEKRYITVFFPFAISFFFAGVIFGYFALIPLGLRFLASYGNGEFIQVGFQLSSYISLFFVLTFVSGMIFELPLVMLFLVKVKLVQTQFFIANWRYALLAAFVIAALLTPPDAITQLLLAFPIITLYFLGIFLCRFSQRIDEIREFVA